LGYDVVPFLQRGQPTLISLNVMYVERATFYIHFPFITVNYSIPISVPLLLKGTCILVCYILLWTESVDGE
jgi:hypothetical protein